MTVTSVRLRKVLSIVVSAAALAAIFAAAALLGALVANATSPAAAAERGALAVFEGVSYEESCWGRSTGVDDFGTVFSRSVSVCD